MNLTYSCDLKEPITSAVRVKSVNETTSPLYFHIKRIMKKSKLATPRTQPIHPRLFQIAARIETFSGTQIIKETTDVRKRPSNDQIQNKRGYSSKELKWTEFKMEAHDAQSVKLAAEFTDWEKFPLDMIRSENGAWTINVPLAPGNYSYRFIVDDQWWTDPSTACAASSLAPEDEIIMNVA